MAHEITIRKDGQAEVFVAGKAPWHKLGQNVEAAQTWEKAIELAHLDWKVEKHPLQAQINNQFVPAHGTFGLFRQDNQKFLGQAGSDYEIIQNRKAFDWVDALVQSEKGAHYVSAGSLHGGSTIWCLAEIPEQLRIKGTDDITRNYLLFANYHQIGKSAIVKNVQERVVCQNTLTVALSEASKSIKIPHRNIETRLEKAKLILSAAKGQIKSINEVMNLLAKCKLKTANIGDIIREVFPEVEKSTIQQNKARDILELFEDNDHNAFPSEAGSAYAMLNAFTHFTDHQASARVVEDGTEDRARARSALFGVGEVFKFAALTGIVTTLAKNSLLSLTSEQTEALGL